MANDTLSQKKRLHLLVQMNTLVFLDMIVRYTKYGKLKLIQEIWEAGIEAKFGIPAEDLEACQLTSLPSSTAIPADLHKLTNLICGE